MESTTPTSVKQTKAAPLHPMVVLQPGEEVVCTIERHPFGLLSQYMAATFGLLLAGTMVFLLAPKFAASSPTIETLLYFGFGVLVVALVGALGISTRVYWQSHWVITSDSLTQVSQNSLFGTQVSQLSLENLEDVTVDQTGVLPHFFNYGTLRAETAGERSKFVFMYCPNPTDYARKIIDAREKFIQNPQSNK